MDEYEYEQDRAEAEGEHVERLSQMDDARRDAAEAFDDRLSMFRNEY